MLHHHFLCQNSSFHFHIVTFHCMSHVVISNCVHCIIVFYCMCHSQSHVSHCDCHCMSHVITSHHMLHHHFPCQISSLHFHIVTFYCMSHVVISNCVCFIVIFHCMCYSQSHVAYCDYPLDVSHHHISSHVTSSLSASDLIHSFPHCDFPLHISHYNFQLCVFCCYFLLHVQWPIPHLML